MTPVYVAKVSVTGGRAGHARSNDGMLDIKLSRPMERGGTDAGTNPEQLFAAGYAACFATALWGQAAQRKTPISTVDIDAEVALGPREEGGFGLAVTLRIKAINGIDRAAAEELVELVHSKICPYSNAIRGNVPVEIILPDTFS